MKTIVLVLMLMTALPADAQEAAVKQAPSNADDAPLTLPKLATIAAGALIGGAAFYLIAEWLFAETVVTASTTTGETAALAASDMAEHSGIITGMTIFGGSSGAILGGIGYDRYHADVEKVFSPGTGAAPPGGGLGSGRR